MRKLMTWADFKPSVESSASFVVNETAPEGWDSYSPPWDTHRLVRFGVKETGYGFGVRDMHNRFLGFALTGVLIVGLSQASSVRADDYILDPAHTAVTFKVSHIGLSWTHGRFKDVSGTFTIDPAKTSFNLGIKTDSIDTDQATRDEHLKSPDFFNAKQFPQISFKSTAVKAIKDGYEVTGDLTLHGVTKSVTFNLMGGKTAELPKGVQRTGFSTELVLKRSDFGLDKFKDAIGDEVHVSISFEGTKK